MAKHQTKGGGGGGGGIDRSLDPISPPGYVTIRKGRAADAEHRSATLKGGKGGGGGAISASGLCVGGPLQQQKVTLATRHIHRTCM